MKKSIALFLSLFAVLSWAQQLEVSIENVESDQGHLLVAVYDNAENFTKTEILSQEVKAKKGKVKLTFKNLKSGKYAIAVLHDKNDNKEMDFNLMGIPKEDYGFSNNAKGFMGPPSFEKASFHIRSGEPKRISISL